jgi:DNA (cytosine-5)-methyltransferase 1
MISPQFILPISNELVIDLFAGGGGASTGIEQAIGRHVDIAINHDPEAILLHQANHPQAKHYVSDVFEVDPIVVTDRRPVGLLWASPDCKHFSKAKGGKPVSKKIRSLAWVVVKWAKAVRPRIIFLENVEEFQTWGPLGSNNLPCPKRKGKTFNQWRTALERLGYVVEHRELRACDYGAPTIRKRLFLIARCDGQPISWPAATHGSAESLPVRQKKLKPWRTAAECIDWSIPTPSIFERKKPLADATLRRIAKGIMRYVIDSANPFIVPIAHFNGSTPVHSINEPLRTVTATPKGGSFALAVPTLIQTGYGERKGQSARALNLSKPIGTIVSSGKHALVSAFIAKHYGGVVGSELADPLATVTSVDHNSLVTANLIHMGHGEGEDGTKRFSHGIRSVEAPINTITASGAPGALVTSHMVKLRNNQFGQSFEESFPTLTAGGSHCGEVRAFLIKYYGSNESTSLNEPTHTVTTKDRFGLVTIKGEEYQIVDIGLRMLSPKELYRAQGFADSYINDIGADGKPLSKKAQVRMCGNSVCPDLARAIVASNYSDQQVQKWVA